MKRFLFWFFWLQIGAPFLVAVGFGAGLPLAGIPILGESIFDCWRVGLAGVVLLSPYLLLNTGIVGCLIRKVNSRTTLRRILMGDSLVAMSLLVIGTLLRDDTTGFKIIPGVSMWILTSMAIVRHIPRWEPEMS